MTTEDLLNKLITVKSNLKTSIQNAYSVDLSNVTFDNYHTYIKKIECPYYFTPRLSITYDSLVDYSYGLKYIYFTWDTNIDISSIYKELCWVNVDTKEEYEVDDVAQGEYLCCQYHNRGTIKLYLKWVKNNATVMSNTVIVTIDQRCFKYGQRIVM